MLQFGARVATSASVNRGQSSVIGVVLVVGMTVMGVTGIMLFGTTALQDSHTRSEIDAAEHAMTQLDSRFSLVALGSAERQGAAVNTREDATMRVDGDQGWMNVSVVDRDAGNYTILNTSLGAVTYENDGTTITYQGGGIWKKSESGGSVMVSPPEFHYRTTGGEHPTLTLPLVVVRGNGSLTEQVAVESDKTVPKFPNASEPYLTNPLGSGEINVTVHSEYYLAWGAFFEERTGGAVSYDHENREVTITLSIPTNTPGVSGGIVATSSQELVISNNIVADSYNSSNDPYGVGGDDTWIVVAGDVRLENNVQIEGNVEAGGSVYLQKATIDGNVKYGDDVEELHNQAEIVGWTASNASVKPPGPVDHLIDDKLDQFAGADTDDDDINDATNQFDCDSVCRLTKGDYYLSEIDLESELVLDTSSGDIEIAVANDVAVEKIDVQGPNTARFYVDGDLTVEDNVTVGSDDRSSQLWFYMNPWTSTSVTFENGANFDGVVYGPGSSSPNPGVTIDLGNNVQIYGGLVGQFNEVGNNVELHFDEALTDENPLPDDAEDQPTVTYMHVTVNRVNVSSR